MATVEIIAIGNEILLGSVLDSNTNWLCKTITGVGGVVKRAAIVPDDVDAIILQYDSAALAPGPYGLVLHGLDSGREYLLPFLVSAR